jgi:hypothetical protein
MADLHRIMKALTPRQFEMLRDYGRDGEATDYSEYHDAAGAALGWRNRERVIDALHRKGLLDQDGVTAIGREVLGAVAEVTS